jgi:3-isopropylmalate dehydratase small subunit
VTPFTDHSGRVAPLDREDVDTDAIIPKQFMKSLDRSGFGDYLFDEWRYLDHGEPGDDCKTRPVNKAFVLNDPRYAQASVLLARSNFGCGSSREHAVWAIRDYGFKVLIAPSFADIFHSNCVNVGLLPATLEHAACDELFAGLGASAFSSLRVDLVEQTIETPAGKSYGFAIDKAARRRLLDGLDPIALTLENAEAVRSYERIRRELEPWLF